MKTSSGLKPWWTGFAAATKAPGRTFRQGINDRGLASRLRPYGIKSKDVRLGDKAKKGYSADAFHDAWNRYCPSASDKRDKGDKGDNSDNKNNFVADVADVADTATTDDCDPFETLKLSRRA